MLTLLTLLPLLGALLLTVVPRERTGWMLNLALFTTGVVAVLGVALLTGFDTALPGFQSTVNAAWFQLPGTDIEARFALGVDGLSILMVGLTAILMPIVLLSATSHVSHRMREFLVWMLVMETGMMGVFLATDLILFYVFWEVSLVPLYFILGIWGGDRRLYATVKFFLYTVAGSLVMLVGVLALIYGAGTSDISRLLPYASGLPLATQSWIFLTFALAFSIKVPVLPFHTWLADAHTEAPTSGSVLLAGVLLKMGIYGLLRFGLQMFPDASVKWSWLFMALGALGIVYGAFLAMAQKDLKRLVACSSVSHLGFCVLGLFALTQAGVRGSILQMVNHGLSTGLLFLLVGMIYERRHTRAIDQFGGLAASMPVFAFFLVFTVLSSVGLPGLNGFVGEYLILFGSFQASPLWGAIGVTGVIFGAVYLLSATRRVLFGSITNEANREVSDLSLREVGLMVPLVLLCVWIGLRPTTFTDLTSASIDQVCENLENARVRLAASETGTPFQTAAITPRSEL